MNVSALITEIDSEIARLQQARKALLSIGHTPAKRGPGRPKGIGKTPVAKKAATKKRTLSPEARAKIAAAQKKRWAASKKAK